MYLRNLILPVTVWPLSEAGLDHKMQFDINFTLFSTDINYDRSRHISVMIGVQSPQSWIYKFIKDGHLFPDLSKHSDPIFNTLTYPYGQFDPKLTTGVEKRQVRLREIASDCAIIWVLANLSTPQADDCVTYFVKSNVDLYVDIEIENHLF